MSYRDRYMSLDPTYTDKYGMPLLRITFDWHDNEYRMAAYTASKMEEIVRQMKPESQADSPAEAWESLRCPHLSKYAHDRRRDNGDQSCKQRH